MIFPKGEHETDCDYEYRKYASERCSGATIHPRGINEHYRDFRDRLLTEIAIHDEVDDLDENFIPYVSECVEYVEPYDPNRERIRTIIKASKEPGYNPDDWFD